MTIRDIEHDDDIEPEVHEGAEIETATYGDAEVTEDLGEGERVRDEPEDASHGGEGEDEPVVDSEDEASDTI